MNHWLTSLLNSLFPSICVLCDAQTKGSLDLCPACYADLPWLHHHCLICSIPLSAGQSAVCGRCLQHRPEYNYCTSAFEYRYPIDKMIINFKSKGQLLTGKVLANLLADTISGQLENHPEPDLIIPIPLHRTQLRSRGFNQSLELADVISVRLGIPVNHQICSRVKKTSAQKNLSAKERKSNLAGAFTVTGPVAGKRIAIVDDVMTTGSTVESLSRLLYKSGAVDVQVWVVARTPGPPGH